MQVSRLPKEAENACVHLREIVLNSNGNMHCKRKVLFGALMTEPGLSFAYPCNACSNRVPCIELISVQKAREFHNGRGFKFTAANFKSWNLAW